MNRKKMFFIITIVLSIIAILVYTNSEFTLNSFSIKVNKNKDNAKILDYSKYNLNGIDEVYLFYEEQSSYIIKVDEKNEISKQEYTGENINIRSSNGEYFQVKLSDSILNEADNFYSENKIIALSDVEGNFDGFSNFLIKNKVIDSSYNWVFGKGNLVLNGDFFDRGQDVTALLWLIYKLDSESVKHGGKVHFIIGNHEEMNLRGNTKYVDEKFIALANKLEIPYADLYGNNTELGRWLRTKNAIVRINNNLFCHAGISPKFIKNDFSINEANNLIKKNLGVSKDSLCDENIKACFLYGREGVMWYRGYFGDYKNYYKGITQQEIDDIINHLDINHIIVGHTIVKKVKTLFDNKVIAIDVRNESENTNNIATSIEGLLIENNKYYRILTDGKKELLF